MVPDPLLTKNHMKRSLALGVLVLVLVSVALVVRPAFRDHTPTKSLPAPKFVEESAQAGIDHTYDGEFTFFVGGGVAAFDCDVDGRPDLYFAGGSEPAGLYRNDSPTGGVLRFTPLPSEITDLTDVTGAYPIDVDGDGVTDLAVLRVGENVMLRGIGDCRFERANEGWGIDGGDDWTAAFSATWEASASLPTLAFGDYLELDEQRDPTGDCSDNVLVRPAGNSAYAPSQTLTPGWCTLSVLFSDWDRSGRHDLRVTNDRHYYRDGEEQMWRLDPGQPPHLYTRAEGWKKMQIWGMGIASYDVTGDGRPEVFLTSQGDNKLQALSDGSSGPAYTDIAVRRGVTAHRPFLGDSVLPSTAWHAEFQDVNNDGFIDLFIAKGNVEAMPEFASEDPNNLLLGEPDGTFTEAAEQAGIVDFARTRGAALADFNLDGMLDLVEVNRRQNIDLWRNIGAGTPEAPQAMGNWIAVRLDEPGSNRDAIGAWIEVKTGDRVATREVTIGGGHAGGQLGWIHFGLGSAPMAEVRVQWPDGHLGPWVRVSANKFVTLDKRSAEPIPWSPPASR